MPVEHIYSTNASSIVCENGCGDVYLSVDENAIANSNAISERINSTRDSLKGEIDYEIEYKLNLIKNEYENQLQRAKVHISGGGRVTGSKIYGRRYKVTIPKRSFRNKTSIVSCPSRTK